MAEIKQCALCRMPFQSLSSKFCHNCLDNIEEDLKKIRDYLYENPGDIGYEVVVRDTGVSRKVIDHLLETGRLESKQQIILGACDICKKPLVVNGTCNECKIRLMADLHSGAPKPQALAREGSGSARPDSRMHIDRRKKP